ncbi:uncharacterized protein B0H18DRAFT_1124536 [Fomitopsis serialis]|uniref:uncharacterized protein n=1 Tax=Fomitopsis serialis TaxID=139415 RepID=UPI0020087485|nr:uncharacterized protein B0H18DRAFT_1124536 [Neoantrodia serialis]KAH9915993.1 hypothetical protein B0H18DRAFT_1124536 [Neoantrodia serialis]
MFILSLYTVMADFARPGSVSLEPHSGGRYHLLGQTHTEAGENPNMPSHALAPPPAIHSAHSGCDGKYWPERVEKWGELPVLVDYILPPGFPGSWDLPHTVGAVFENGVIQATDHHNDRCRHLIVYPQAAIIPEARTYACIHSSPFLSTEHPSVALSVVLCNVQLISSVIDV